MKKVSSILFPLILMIPPSLAAQAPQNSVSPLDVSVCDLLSQPNKYNGQLVRARGRISIEFEDFSLSRSDCPYQPEEKDGAVGVWLIYGGDQGSPTVYCCGDHSRKPGEKVEIQGRLIPLLRDEQLLEFQRRISAERQVRPDGLMCQSRECYLYDVTATITGHFFSQERTPEGTIGFGHFGMFHALFIEQVTNVDARRTHVPAGGIFDCKTDTWDAPRSTVGEILRAYKDCHDPKSCEDGLRLALMMGAKHWGEPLEQVERWSKGMGDEAEHYWSSPDLLTTLNFKFPYTNPNIRRSRSEFSATRTTCSAMAKPLPQSAKVSCDARGWAADNPKEMARSAQENVDRGSDLWRTEFQEVAWSAVLDYAATNSIILSPNLVVDSCQANAVGEDEYAFCLWKSRDGLQAVSVSLIRYGTLSSADRPKERTAWVPLYGSISICKAE